MTRGVAALAAVLVAVFPGRHVAAQDTLQRLENFELFTNCAQMTLVVENLSDDAADIGLTRERIQTIAESRLRAARLYDEDVLSPYLHIHVRVLSRSFSIEIAFKKRLFDAESAYCGAATTWNRSGLGTHGGAASYILQHLSELLDRFMLDYLRVNEDACDASPGG